MYIPTRGIRAHVYRLHMHARASTRAMTCKLCARVWQWQNIDDDASVYDIYVCATHTRIVRRKYPAREYIILRAVWSCAVAVFLFRKGNRRKRKKKIEKKKGLLLCVAITHERERRKEGHETAERRTRPQRVIKVYAEGRSKRSIGKKTNTASDALINARRSLYTAPFSMLIKINWLNNSERRMLQTHPLSFSYSFSLWWKGATRISCRISGPRNRRCWYLREKIIN